MPSYFISILIPVKGDNAYLKQCLKHCLKLNYPAYEIIILPDQFLPGYENPKVRIIPTGDVYPARKRDLGAGNSRGDILAFLDNDAYPSPDWLKNAMANFDNQAVVAVGGPAVTPEEDSLFQQASGLVFASSITSGAYTYRYKKNCKKILIDDFPSCNFLIRKSAFLELGGFNTNYWPGEDTILCLGITKELKHNIIYDPGVLVYHHRRPLFSAHLKQIANYALHRGYFVKKFPETSKRLTYFLPSALLLLVALGFLLSFFWLPIRILYFCFILLYITIVLVNSLSRNLKLTGLVFCGIILTHLVYGFNFLKGLLINKLHK